MRDLSNEIKLFADGADLETAHRLIEKYNVKGFTTNPTLMHKEGITEYEEFSKKFIAGIGEYSVSLEVFEDDIEGMEKQARIINGWGDNIYIKIPIMNTQRVSTTELVKKLNAGGAKINVTAVFTKEQIDSLVDCFQGNTPGIVSVFAGRIADAGEDPCEMVRYAVEKFKDKPHIEVLWASPREVYNIIEAINSGADIITVPYSLLEKLSKIGKDLTDFSQETVQMFRTDAINSRFNLEDSLGITLIFPMAGKGTRFGSGFKPFLKVEDETFIELAYKGFKKWERNIKEVIFVFLDEHEQKYDVSKKLNELFPNLNYRTVILDQETSGSVETVRTAIKEGNITGKVIVCNDDHYVSVDPLFNRLLEKGSEKCMIPLWNLKGEEIKSWSIVSVSDTGVINSIAEKELPKTPGEFFGVIGCYFFDDTSLIGGDKIYISEIIQGILDKGHEVKGVEIHDAEFFGDPERLQNVLNKRKGRIGAVFCEIDGTLIEHTGVPDYREPVKVLPGTIEKMKKWKKEGHKIILITNRKESDREKLILALGTANILYDDLIMNVPHGTKYLINNREPSSTVVPQAVAFETAKNKGIDNIEIDSSKPTVLKRFGGGSFSDTLLLEKSGKLIVRKTISKQSALGEYPKLKKQYSDLKRISSLCPEIIPEILEENENSFEYFYDLEFLAGYSKLSEIPNNEKLRAVCEILLPKMSAKIYNNKINLSEGDKWILNHFKEKIYPKLAKENLPEKLFSLIDKEKVVIDGKEHPGLSALLRKVISKPYIDYLKPRTLCPTHGDLTLENVLYKSTEGFEPSIKLIDTDSIELVDPPELDLGKMFQSIVGQYEAWSAVKDNLVNINHLGEISLNFNYDQELLGDVGKYVEAWSSVIEGNEKEIMAKAYFYMSLHLIRMIPFRLKVSEDQALYALITAIKSMNYALDKIDELN